MVRNPKDRLSRVDAHLSILIISLIKYFTQIDVCVFLVVLNKITVSGEKSLF